MSLCSYTEKMVLNAPVQKVFEYFTDSDQIASDLPSSLHIQVVQRTSRHLTQGSSIHFRARIYGFPVTWKSYVHSFSTNRHLAYMWQNSVLRSWEHDYYFEAIASNQTRITECILYHTSFGTLGKWGNRFLLRPLISRAFKYRKERLQERFPTSRTSTETRIPSRSAQMESRSTPRFST